ncbi:ABC transporter permease [Allostreptomyces psammosilenae]|uniref:Ribose transport system permease protein n=1 Tax=Allostreptomyces psammosilenae TaxID=1892865 RepID=A0A853A1A6_9ACTN|nr:ABC transporter permease [Allostreptomyces psammosilenae]NYI06704.1 ribose transport system permease protein [Allostreptomyces psammosilenae]
MSTSAGGPSLDKPRRGPESTPTPASGAAGTAAARSTGGASTTTPPTGDGRRSGAWARLTGGGGVRNLGLVGVLLLLVLVGAITSPDQFLSTSNLVVILTQASVIGVVTVGMTFVIIGGGIDLSVGAIVALATVWATTLATQSYGLGGILFCAIAVGLGCGLLNGVLVAYGRMVPFIATLAMMASARGLSLQISGGLTQVVQVDSVLSLGYRESRILGIPPLVIIWVAVIVLGWLVLNRTTYGRRLFALGGNPEAARLAGIDVRRQRLTLYLVSGLCCGIASFMLIVLTGSGQNTNGNLYELDAIAAVIIGGTLLTGGRGTLIGSVLGVLVFTTISNLFALNNLQSAVQDIASGAIIVIAVLIQRQSGGQSRAG